MYHQYQKQESKSPSPDAPVNGPNPRPYSPSPPSALPMPLSAHRSAPFRHPPPPNPKGKAAAGEVSESDSFSSVTIIHNDEEISVPKEANESMPATDLFAPMQLARAHWIQLHKTNMQIPILKRVFLQLLQQHPQLRALWPFARTFDGSAARLEQMVHGSVFRHFCQSYRASFTLLMDNLDDEPALCLLLQEFGSNHFFYDCVETHIRLMRNEFFRNLVDCLSGTSEELDEELAEDWEKFWAKLESNIAFGLRVQRHNYLAHCMTPGEMALVREQWQKLAGAEGGIGRLPEQIGGQGTERLLELLSVLGLCEGNELDLRALFGRASRELLWAMGKAVLLWEPGTGFLRLCAEIDGKCLAMNELLQRASAPMVRRSFMEAFLAELFGVEPAAEEAAAGTSMAGNGTGNGSNTAAIHSWTKLYRVAEQAIIADELDRNERGTHKSMD